MPTYSYLCTECAHEFDIHQSFTDESLTVCPSCGGALRKVFSPVGVSFNGSGFYRNDSREQPSGKLPARTGGSDKAAAGASGGKESSSSTPGGTAAGASTGGGSGSTSAGSNGAGSSSGKSSGKPSGTSAPAANK